MTYSPERLAYWYFRLNGFLTIENFIVHPDVGRLQRTDADVLAVRFMHRAENDVSPMQDDSRVVNCDSFTNIIIAEVKRNHCDLNVTWTDPSRENIDRVLHAIGCVREDAIPKAASSLYKSGLCKVGTVSVRLFAIGEQESELKIPRTQQLTWSEIIQFMITRFCEYEQQKSRVGQWKTDGVKLRRLALNRDAAAIRLLFGLRAGEDPDA